jgi:serine/threonine-protein kinase
MSTDLNLLFGVLALQADFLDAGQFAEACSAWAARKDTSLADLVVQRGWLSTEDRAHVEYLLQRKLKKHHGDIRASLAEVTTNPVRHSLASLGDADVQQSLATLPPAGLSSPGSTTAYQPEGRGRYTLTRLHATGGIGQVWLARDPALGRDVALKELRPERNAHPTARARFLEEACITGQLEHPGIVPVHELVCSAEGQPFYTMRLVRGRTLAEGIKEYHRTRQANQAGPLELRTLLGKFVAVCNAVAYAHSRGVLHRDLKPANVVLGDFGEVVVLDWGLARLLGQQERGEVTRLLPVSLEAGSRDETIQGQVVGTPAYMAPEQAEGRLDLLGPATDVYGLGAVLYEILSGQPPFGGSSDEVLRRVAREEPARPRLHVPAVPAALEAVCLKALAKTPADRYPSAGLLAQEIEHWLADEPVKAWREPWRVRAGRWVRQHQPLVAGLAAAALVAVLSLTIATVLLSAANRRESEARVLAQQRGEDAEREAARAQANFQMARDAVEEYCTKVSNDPRLKEKDLEGLRKELLQSAVKFHQKFVDQHGDDPALRADLGRAYADLGELLTNIENLTRGIAITRRAVAIYEQLALEQPQDRSHPLQLAQSLNTLGRALDNSARPKESQAAYSRALQTLEVERQRHGDSLLLRRVYLRSCNRLGHLLMHKLGAEAAAINVHRKAVASLPGEGKPAATEPDDIVLEAESCAMLGRVLVDAGQPKEGQLWCARALNRLEPLTARGALPASLNYGLTVIYNSVGRAYAGMQDWRKAIEVNRKCVEVDQQLVAAHPNVRLYQEGLGIDLNYLGLTQINAGQREEGLASFRKSLEVKEQLAARHPEVPDYQANLARTLDNLSLHTADLDQARAYQRRALKLLEELNGRHPGVTQYLQALASSYRFAAIVHQRAGEIRESIEAIDRAIALQEELVKTTDVVTYRQALTRYCCFKVDLCLSVGEVGPAVTAFRKARVNDCYDPALLFHCGTALMNNGQLDEAIQALTRVLALKADLAEAQCNLGHCLVRKGRYVEGRAALQRGHELGVRRPDWRYPSQEWVRFADQMIRLDGRLSAIRAGQAEPASNSERIALAQMCQHHKHLYATAARFFAAAFAGIPQLADDLKAGYRYNAARAAALAGCGKGEDASKLDDREKARLRNQALDWLRADLVLYRKQLDSGNTAGRAAVAAKMKHWRQEDDLAGVRDKPALAGLPDAERGAWGALWMEAAALLARASATSSAP